MRLTPLARWGKAPTDTAHLSRWTYAPRVSQSRADYASPVTRYPHERSWLASDVVIAAVLVGVVLWFCFGGGL